MDRHIKGEHRKYTRLDSVFPVQFKLASFEGSILLSGWLQGFTSDIGKGGICLRVNNLPEETAQLLKAKKAKLLLEMEIPLDGKPVEALADIAWVKVNWPEQYLIGLAYERIDARDNARVLRHARRKKFFLPASLGVIIILGAVILTNGFFNIRLTRKNKELVSQLVRVMEESGLARQKVEEISAERSQLQDKIQALMHGIKKAESEKRKVLEKISYTQAAKPGKFEELTQLTGQLLAEKAALEDKLLALSAKEASAGARLQSIGARRASLEKANFEKMYQWVKAHQNTRTGLQMSFEGDSDIANWGFTYDQSLAAQAHTYFGDFERALKIFNFFERQAERQEGLFFNAYYAADGSPAEYTVHSGPNIWLGIAIMQYINKTRDNAYLGLAQDIARAIMALQGEDGDGGVRGGPNVRWYSTEHNLDAYAFFNMLYELTGRKEYSAAAEKSLAWLVKHTYAKSEIPISRGKGDSTIATDTYAWAIAAVGPERLKEVGMNPERIMEFAEKNCVITTSYTRPEGGIIRVKGCDFSSQKNLARGGIVSTEWTGQMIVAHKIMAGYYKQKGDAAGSAAYAAKAEEYLSELLKMVISSPSPSGQGESCLPYASQDFVDTGHGWHTPKGKSTGSLAGTTYVIFAYYGYNPLKLKD